MGRNNDEDPDDRKGRRAMSASKGDSFLDKFSLKGKTAIVTGGGSGLGREICMAFARAEANVVIAGRRQEVINAVASEVVRIGSKGVAVPTDVTDSAQVRRLVQRTVDVFGGIDILVNNAGIAKGVDPSPDDALNLRPKSIWEISDEEWRYSIDTNLTGTFYCCREVGRYMVPQKAGKVINMASVGGLRGVRGNFGYCTAKGGVVQLTRTLAVTWAEENIQVNSVAPGFLPVKDLPAEVVAKSEGFFPMGRFGLPKEIGPLCVFLASAASDYVTGECFVIDGAASAGYAPTGYNP